MAHNKAAWGSDHAELFEAQYRREHACHQGDCGAEDTVRCDNCGDYFCAAHLTTDDRWVYCGACVDEMRADEATLAPVALAA